MNKSKRFSIYLYIELISAILFSLVSLSFHGDISLSAFPLSLIFTGVTVYFSFFKFLKPKDGKKSTVVLKLIQYLPFVLFVAFILRRAGNYGTSFIYDVISVFIWCVNFVFSLIISNCMNDKHIGIYTADWKIPGKKIQKPKGTLRILFEVVDWVDALIQAVFMVLLIQIFILQLYVIPSESMVPTFLIKDRVAVSKLNCGPKFPLTEVGLPCMTKYKRGDIVVLRNPHYSMDRKSEVKSVTSQLIYMLTFMSVNLNRDEDGNIKADPLVKRITGVEGEQLVMQDGILYSRTKDNPEFTPVTQDAKFACWNLNTIKQNLKPGVKEFKLTNTEYEAMLELEAERRNFSLSVAKLQTEEIVNKMKMLVSDGNKTGTFGEPVLHIYNMFLNSSDTARRIYSQNGGIEWFEKFMTSWFDSASDMRDIYAEANFKYNVMSKICFGNLIVRYAELLKDNVSFTEWKSDDYVIKYLTEAQTLVWYVCVLMDERNMPVFPANASDGTPNYIPQDCFFMMGDNRFNSLDLRHRYTALSVKLSDSDKYSFEYESIMEPQYINKKLILGKPMFRFWPAGRTGAIN